jgi:hypothetical protein
MTLRTSAIAIFRRSFSAALMRVVCGIPEKNSTCAHKPRRAALSPPPLPYRSPYATPYRTPPPYSALSAQR